jgi:hypothetical protein
MQNNLHLLRFVLSLSKKSLLFFFVEKIYIIPEATRRGLLFLAVF